jgi:hypothetical protein
LTISNLCDWGSYGCGALGLAITDLRDRRRGSGECWLSIRLLAGAARSTTGENVDEDRFAMFSPGAVVEVGEISTLACVEDSRATDSQRTVLAD